MSEQIDAMREAFELEEQGSSEWWINKAWREFQGHWFRKGYQAALRSQQMQDAVNQNIRFRGKVQELEGLIINALL